MIPIITLEEADIVNECLLSTEPDLHLNPKSPVVLAHTSNLLCNEMINLVIEDWSLEVEISDKNIHDKVSNDYGTYDPEYLEAYSGIQILCIFFHEFR